MRLIRFAVWLVAVFLLLMPISVGAQEIMDLEECLVIALENNPGLNAEIRGVEEAQAHIGAMRADFLPSLSTSYSYNGLISEGSKGAGATDADYLDQTVRSFGVTISQILFSGFRVLNQYKRAELEKEVAQANLDLKRAELIYQVEAAFYRMMKSSQDVVATKESILALEENLKSTESFFKKELVPWVDVLQVRVNLADVREQWHMAENNVRREKADLFALMGRPVDNAIRFESISYEVPKEVLDFDFCYGKALTFRPDIQRLESQMAIAEKDAASSLGSYLPQVRLKGGYYDYTRNYDALTSYGTSRDQRNQYWSAGVYASWELFDGGRSWYGRKEALARVDKLRALVRDAKHTISKSIQKALFSMADAKQRIATAREAMLAADEYVANQEKRLMAGVSTVTDLLNAQNRRVRAKGNLAQAVLDFQLANSELALFTGDQEERL